MTSVDNSAKKSEIIHINLWDNDKASYVPLLALSQKPGERGMVYVSKPPPIPGESQRIAIGVDALDRKTPSSIPAGLKHLLGGIFANKIVAAKYPGWEKLNDFERLRELGSRDVGCLQVRVVSTNSQPNRAPIIGDAELKSILGEIEVAIGTNDLRNLLTERNFTSIVNTHGSTLKVEYQSEDGERWIVKRGAATDGADFDNTLTRLQSDANIASCTTKTFAHDGYNYLMVKRYDVAEPFKRSGESNPRLYDHKTKREVVPLKTLMQLEEIKGKPVRPCYSDIVRLIAEYTGDRNQIAEKLYARAIFNNLIKNHEYSVDSIAIISSENGYQLTPAPAASFNLAEDRSPLPMAAAYPYGQMIDFSPRFYAAVAEEFGLPADRTKRITELVAGGLLNAEKKSQLYGLTEEKASALHGHLSSGGGLERIKEQSQEKYKINLNEMERLAAPVLSFGPN